MKHIRELWTPYAIPYQRSDNQNHQMDDGVWQQEKSFHQSGCVINIISHGRTLFCFPFAPKKFIK